MMDNISTFRIELDVAAQRVIHQFMMSNNSIEEQLTKAIQKTVDNFDFENEVRQIVEQQLRKALRDAMSYGPLEKLVKEKTQKLYNELIEKEFQKFQQ